MPRAVTRRKSHCIYANWYIHTSDSFPAFAGANIRVLMCAAISAAIIEAIKLRVKRWVRSSVVRTFPVPHASSARKIPLFALRLLVSRRTSINRLTATDSQVSPNSAGDYMHVRTSPAALAPLFRCICPRSKAAPGIVVFEYAFMTAYFPTSIYRRSTPLMQLGHNPSAVQVWNVNDSLTFTRAADHEQMSSLSCGTDIAKWALIGILVCTGSV